MSAPSNSPGPPRNRAAAWFRWILLMEGMILVLAAIGPGSRYTLRNEGDQALIARWFVDDPTFLEAVGINVVVLHVFIGVVWGLARIVTRRRARR